MRVSLWVVALAMLSSGAVFGQSADFYTVEPCRLYDSRDGDGPFTPAEQRELQVATDCGVPYDAVAVTANLTAADATSTGSFIVFPNATEPTVSNALSYRPGINIAAGGIYPLSGNGLGTLSVLADLAAGQVDLVFDITGYFLRSSGGPSPSVVTACKTGDVKAIDCWEGSVKLRGSIPTTKEIEAFYIKLYRDAKIKVTFTREAPFLQYTTYAYWDGELSFSFRTAFPYNGSWTWTATCEAGCQGRTVVQPLPEKRKVTVGLRRQSPLLYSRGFLSAHSSGRYLVHQNGTKFFWLGDTAWAAPMRTASVASSTSTWTAYLTDRATPPGNYPPAPSAPTAGKYSVIQVALAFHAGAGGYTVCTDLKCIPTAKLKAFTTTGSLDKGVPRVPNSKSYWNPEYWRNLDRLVYQANELGLVVVLTGVMDPFGEGSDKVAEGNDLAVFARNLAARMAGFFVIYSVGWDNRVEDPTFTCGSDVIPSSIVKGFDLKPAVVSKMNQVGVALNGATGSLITTHRGTPAT
jgi:hypothetical protein